MDQLIGDSPIGDNYNHFILNQFFISNDVFPESTHNFISALSSFRMVDGDISFGVFLIPPLLVK